MPIGISLWILSLIPPEILLGISFWILLSIIHETASGTSRIYLGFSPFKYFARDFTRDSFRDFFLKFYSGCIQWFLLGFLHWPFLCFLVRFLPRYSRDYFKDSSRYFFRDFSKDFCRYSFIDFPWIPLGISPETPYGILPGIHSEIYLGILLGYSHRFLQKFQKFLPNFHRKPSRDFIGDSFLDFF